VGRNIKEVMAFHKLIPLGTTDVLHERVKGEGTIEGIKVRFYSGQVHALQVRVFVEHKGNKIEDLITYVSTGKEVLTGDDDNFSFPVVVPVSNDDVVKVWVKNDSSTKGHNLSVDVIVDYYGGQNRVIGGLSEE
jgi:hypothetical protein